MKKKGRPSGSTAIPFAIDAPRAEDINRPYRIPVTGWFFAGESHPFVDLLTVWSGGACIGKTELFYERPDVNGHLKLPSGIRTGFTLQCAIPANSLSAGGETAVPLELLLHLHDGRTVYLAAHSAMVRSNPKTGFFYHTLQPGVETLLRREAVYQSGPTLDDVNRDVVDLLHRYLGEARHILDVGCGSGPYSRPMTEKGYQWTGAEVKESDCATMKARSLPHARVIPGQPLPFADEQFDAAMCIEVLEHIEDPDAFLTEIKRVISGRLLLSVPNAELLPLLSVHHVIPFHMVEPDHKNFFTRFSLGALLRRHFPLVEVLDYAPLPIGNLIGETLPYHLFAIAGKRTNAGH
jgi:2-polyprenyl-3-methyl-5-hydroxy-6-metoxy-1,4-benzoquinol methylase